MTWRTLKTIIVVTLLKILAGLSIAAADLPSTSDYIITTWQTESGLPNNTVNALAQTTNGFLWIGMPDGLARFDGVRYTVFNGGNTPALRSGNITALCGDKHGVLWIGLETGGLVRFQDGTFSRVTSTTPLPNVLSILASKNGEVFIGTDRGLFRSSGEEGADIRKEESLGEGRVRALCEDPNGMIWIGTANGLWKYTAGQMLAVAPKGAEISALAITSDGVLWIGGETFGLLQLNSDGEVPRRVWPVSGVTALCLSRKGDIWMAKGGATLEKLSVEKGKISEVGIKASEITCLFEDGEGSLWIGTAAAGLAQVRERRLRVFGIERGDRIQGVLSVTQGINGEIWVAGETGEIYQLINNSLQLVAFKESQPVTRYFETVLADRSGGLWAGTRFDGLYYWGGRNGSALQHRSSTVGISALFQDRQGRLWIGAGKEGVVLIEKGMERVIRSPDGTPFQQVSCFAEDLEGRIWIGTRRSGLAEWRNGNVQRHSTEPTLRDARIQSLFSDFEGNLWIGTNRGIIVRRGGRFIKAASNDGPGSVHQIAEDLRGNLWFGSDRGLFRAVKVDLDKVVGGENAQLHFAPFALDEEARELEISAVSQPSAWKGSAGKLWFATRQGLAEVDTLQDSAEELPPLPVIEEVRLEHTEVIGRPFLLNEEAVRIPANYERIHIRFTSPIFVDPHYLEFRFRIPGVDSSWVLADGDRTASYGKLRKGDYYFELAVRKRGGEWNQQLATVLLRIAPHYWETTWFRTVIAGLLLALIAVLWTQRVAKKHEMNGLRRQITRDLHDDLGSNIGSIALLSEALQNPQSRPSNSNNELLGEINRIARQTLESMRDAVWFVDPEKDSTADLAAHLRQVAASLLRNTSYHFEGPDKPPAVKLPLDLKRGAVLIFKEAIHNVLRHSGATHVDVFVELNPHWFEFLIRDNGSGFDPSAQTNGHGLSNMHHRAERLGGTLKIESNGGQGTRILFRVKLS